MFAVQCNKNEATAARRRVYFQLVDATDGMTPETGEGGGQPEVSRDGGVWTGVGGISALTHIGSGRYYADVVQGATNYDNAVLQSRYKSANTAEAVGSTLIVGMSINAIDGALTSGNNATLNLKQLNVVNSAGDAIVATSSGANGSGIKATGNGSGHGVVSTGGLTGHGIYSLGGATSGDGIKALGAGSGHGLAATAGATGHGIIATAIGAAKHAIYGNAAGAAGHGIVGYALDGSGMFLNGAGAGQDLALNTNTSDLATDDDVAAVTTLLGAPAGASVSADIAALTGVVTEGVPHFYHPDNTSAVVTGVLASGTWADLAARDDTVVQVNEVADGIEYIAEISGIVADHVLNGLAFTGYYSGNHTVVVQAWNYVTLAWENKLTMNDRASAFDYAAGLTGDNVDASGDARIRWYHAAPGNVAHRLYLDHVEVSAVESTNESALQIAAILSLVNDIDNETENITTAVALLPDAAAVNAEVDQALADYDPPTKAEMDAGFAGIGAVDVGAALVAYDAATGAQVTAVGALVDALPTLAEIIAGTPVGWATVTHASPGMSVAEVDNVPTAHVLITAYLSTDANYENPVNQTESEADGEWSISLPPAATYNLRFTHDGATPVNVEVTT